MAPNAKQGRSSATGVPSSTPRRLSLPLLPSLFLLLASGGGAASHLKNADDESQLLQSRERRTPPFGIGTVMPLTEAGYLRVASRRNDSEMETFIRRVLRQHGKEVSDENGLHGFARFFSGSQAVQTLEALKSELKEAPWAMAHQQQKESEDASSTEAFVNETVFRNMVEKGNEEDLTSFLRNMMWHERRQVLRKSDFVSFVRTLKEPSSGGKTLQEVQQALRSAPWAQPAEQPNLSLLLSSKLASPVETSLQQLQKVAREMTDKATKDYEQKRTRLQTARSAYQANLQNLDRRNAAFAQILGSVQGNISAQEARNFKEAQEALHLQAQNHARTKVMGTLHERLGTAVAFLEDSISANFSSAFDVHISERPDFQFFLRAAREELGLVNSSFNFPLATQQEAPSNLGDVALIQLDMDSGRSPAAAIQAADFEDALKDQADTDTVGAGQEVEQTNSAQEVVHSLSSGLTTMNKAANTAREILEANYEAGVKHYTQRFESMVSTQRQLLQRQQEVAAHSAELAHAKEELNSINGVIGDRIAWLKMFMEKASDVARVAATDAGAVLEQNS